MVRLTTGELPLFVKQCAHLQETGRRPEQQSPVRGLEQEGEESREEVNTVQY